MAKLVLFLILLFPVEFSNSSDKKVYVCISPNEKVYHNDKNCASLLRCKHDVIEVPKVDAIGKYKRVLCEDER